MKILKFFSLDAGNRIFGLDLLRFFAIFFVLLGHSAILIPTTYKTEVKSFVLDGVAIFFVLSGFLIGNILLKQIKKGETNFPDLFTFWKRRWMRTIPAYFVVLSFLLIYTFYLKPTRIPEEWWRYFLFVQNFAHSLPPFFQESWSLSVEEWFYLLIPTIFFISLFIFKKNKRIVIVTLILSVLVSVFLYRWYLFSNLEILTNKAVQNDVLQQVIPRLDGIMIGVLAAFIASEFPKIWQKMNIWQLFILMVILIFVVKLISPSNLSFYYCVLAPLLKSICVFFMLPFLANFKLNKNNFIAKSITFVSITSYSIYLVNRTIVIDIIIKYLINDNLKSKHITNENWIFQYILFWTLSFSLAFLMYKLIEKPFLKLRDLNSKKLN